MWFSTVLLLIFITYAHTLEDESENKETHRRVACETSFMYKVRSVTPSGVIRGSWNVTRRGRRFQSFRGIRYAEPPVGELRFKPPHPIYVYPEEVDATREGPACPMPVDAQFYNVIDEDCLRLNVYTPVSKSSNARLPVIVFIHPGAFYVFSGRSDVWGPDYLLDRDIVLVTINYRLGSLGFLSTGDKLAPGNNGLKDQVAALRWIHRNIEAYGGDPTQVTITGCSAGSFSVLLHMVSPMSKGLFHRAISVSGSPISNAFLRHDFIDLAVRQAELLNCPTYSSKAIIDCLKTKSFRDFGNSLTGFFIFDDDPTLLWNAVVEQDFGQERFLIEQPLDSIRRGHFHAVPYIITQNRNEFFWKAYTVLNNATLLKQINEDFEDVAPIAFQLPKGNSRKAAGYLKEKYLDGRDVVNDTVSALGVGRLYGDGLIGFGVHRLANLMCRNSPYPVYYGEFDYIGNNSFYESPATGKPVGVAHQDDLLYIFAIRYRFPVIPLGPTADSFMVDRMTAIWYNFARFGDPNPRGDTPEIQDLVWPAMTPDKREYVRLKLKFSIHERLFEYFFRIWEYLYPISYDPQKSFFGKFGLEKGFL